MYVCVKLPPKNLNPDLCPLQPTSTYTCGVTITLSRAVQPTRPLAQPAQPARTRPAFTRSDCSNGQPRVPSSKTRRRQVGFEFPRSKPVKPDPPEDINSGEFSIDSDEFSA